MIKHRSLKAILEEMADCAEVLADDLRPGVRANGVLKNARDRIQELAKERKEWKA